MNNFKKFVVCFVVSIIVSTSSYASISINLKKSFNIWADSSGTVLPTGCLVQLIWSADNAYVDPLAGSIPGAAGGTYTSGANTDYVLYSAATTVTSGWSGDYDGNLVYNNGNVGGANINGGFVYAYVFANGAPGAGDWYGRSILLGGLSDASSLPTPPADALDVSPTSANRMVVHPSTGGYQVQAVPEPSTMALGLLGVAIITLRRKLMR